MTRAEVVAFVRQNEGAGSIQVARGLSITAKLADQHLGRAVQMGELMRTGSMGSYRYSVGPLPPAAPGSLSAAEGRMVAIDAEIETLRRERVAVAAFINAWRAA